MIFDTESKSSVIKEANRLQIPVVGLVDSSMPWETYSKITYPVPANDSVEFVYMFCNLITKTILKERKEAMAERGEEAVIGYGNFASLLLVLASKFHDAISKVLFLDSQFVIFSAISLSEVYFDNIWEFIDVYLSSFECMALIYCSGPQ